MKGWIRTAVLAIAVLGSFAALSQRQARAQTAEDCIVQQAADAALQRQIAMIDAAKVNVPEFFSGANSCINPNLLQSFDLSMAIPDLAGFLQNGIIGLAQQALDQAKQQVCSVLNSQLSGLIGGLKGAIRNYESKVGQELAGIVSQGTGSLDRIDLTGLGNYNFGTSSFNSLSNRQFTPTFTINGSNLSSSPPITDTPVPSTGDNDFARRMFGG